MILNFVLHPSIKFCWNFLCVFQCSHRVCIIHLLLVRYCCCYYKKKIAFVCDGNVKRNIQIIVLHNKNAFIRLFIVTFIFQIAHHFVAFSCEFHLMLVRLPLFFASIARIKDAFKQFRKLSSHCWAFDYERNERRNCSTCLDIHFKSVTAS